MPGLTDLRLKKLLPKATLYRVADAGGLCIEIHPGGGRYWRYRYRFAGKAKMLSLGTYPAVPLREARQGRDKAKAMLREGTDPSAQRRADEQSRRHAIANTFEAVAQEWLGRQQTHLAAITHAKHAWMLNDLALPWIGKRPIAELSSADILEVLRRVEDRGKLETAQRLKQVISRIFRHAATTGRVQHDPTALLKGALATPKTRHRASIIEPAGIAALLRDIHAYQGSLVTVSALKLAPLVFVRPGELRQAEWSEFDLAAAQWRIPGPRMKMKEPHIVPLSEQALAILRELRPLTERSQYVFPSVRSGDRPMSENTVNAALRRLGYDKDTMTGHGFRSMASTRLHEMGWNTAIIERQLAHAERNKVKAAYNYAEHLPERHKLMQQWADYLDALREGREGRKVIAGSFGRAA